jgi:nucleotide-binding universal stress UspA family protein
VLVDNANIDNMKTVLVPVDFSDVSANALLFAAELCKRASARLIIVNILKKGEDEEEIKNRLESTGANLKKIFGSDLMCEWSFAHGNFITTLKKITAVQKPDLIVMGTKGASGLKEIFIGSNTVKVMGNVNTPVFVIPETARFENFLDQGKRRIVLATDLEFFEEEKALNVLKEIALLIKEPKIRVLNVRPENTGLSYEKRAERSFLLSVFQPEIETQRFTMFSSSVMGGINAYLNENADTGLIAMMARDSGHLMQKHYTREMASHTHLPLLVLHDKKV